MTSHADDDIIESQHWQGFMLWGAHVRELQLACESGPCLNGGVCTETATGYECLCADGFSGSQCQGLFIQLMQFYLFIKSSLIYMS